MRYTDRKVPAALEGGENAKEDAEKDGEDTVEERHLDITLHQHQQTTIVFSYKGI
jgi:hypothetical protein